MYTYVYAFVRASGNTIDVGMYTQNNHQFILLAGTSGGTYSAHVLWDAQFQWIDSVCSLFAEPPTYCVRSAKPEKQAHANVNKNTLRLSNITAESVARTSIHSKVFRFTWIVSPFGLRENLIGTTTTTATTSFGVAVYLHASLNWQSIFRIYMLWIYTCVCISFPSNNKHIPFCWRRTILVKPNTSTHVAHHTAILMHILYIERTTNKQQPGTDSNIIISAMIGFRENNPNPNRKHGSPKCWASLCCRMHTFSDDSIIVLSSAPLSLSLVWIMFARRRQYASLDCTYLYMLSVKAKVYTYSRWLFVSVWTIRRGRTEDVLAPVAKTHPQMRSSQADTNRCWARFPMLERYACMFVICGSHVAECMRTQKTSRHHYAPRTVGFSVGKCLHGQRICVREHSPSRRSRCVICCLFVVFARGTARIHHFSIRPTGD